MATLRCSNILHVLAPFTLPSRSKVIPRSLTRCISERNGASISGSSSQVDDDDWDVSRSCVNPVFRGPVFQEPDLNSSKVRITFASEGNVCRSVLAEATFNSLLQQAGLEDIVDCTSKATKEFNVGEPPDERTVQVANERGLSLHEGRVAELLNFAKEIVETDLIIVMDKYDASDVMKQVVLQEVVDKRTVYSHKVRRLGDFCKSREVDDIDDPLYGNMGGPEELEMLNQAFDDIRDSCQGLVQHLLRVKANLGESESMKEAVQRSTKELGTMEWLVPPMLQR